MIASAAGWEGTQIFLYSTLRGSVCSGQALDGLLGLQWTQAGAEGRVCFLNFLREGQRDLSWLEIQLQLRLVHPGPKRKAPGTVLAYLVRTFGMCACQ